MARITFDGFDREETRLGLMTRGNARRIVTAGGEAAVAWEKQTTSEHGHARTGQMLGSIGMTDYKEDLNGGSVEVYPLGTDSKGTRNALKAFVTNYGRGGASGPKMADRFITGNMRRGKQAAAAAMQAEHLKIIAEANGGG